jgi:hypothetical protein
MSDALTQLNQEFKEAVDPGWQRFFARKQTVSSPSYFANFFVFSPFLPLRMSPMLRKRRVPSRGKILRTAAFMAIV